MEFLLLQNGMDKKIDIYATSINLKQTGRLIAINVNNISSIKLKYTKYDKINNKYFVINLINKEKIYVNEFIAVPTGLLRIDYTRNADYEVVDTFIRCPHA